MKTDRNFCVASAIALDNRTLADSRRILLLHLTDVKVEKTEFSSEKMQILLKEGDGPVLARRGRADFSLKLNRPPKKLYALDCSGRRLKEFHSSTQMERSFSQRTLSVQTKSSLPMNFSPEQ